MGYSLLKLSEESIQVFLQKSVSCSHQSKSIKKMNKITLLFSVGLFTCLSFAQDKAKRLDSLMTNLYKEKSFNGNVLVAEKGNIIYQKSFGLANEKTGQKLDLKTNFELASVSKQFTAMAIVQLQKAGKLQYDDPISKYLPELAFYQGITIKNLLTHTGGLPDYMEVLSSEWKTNDIVTNNDVIKIFEKVKPAALFKPNQKWEYSNTGYLLLASIIERVSGKSFGDYLSDKIFKPLKMNNTFIYRRWFKPEKKSNYAAGYIYSDSLQRKITPDEMGIDYYVVVLDGVVGDGMVNSNLEDMLKWDRALYGDKLINKADKDLIFSSSKTADDQDTDYGYGWRIAQNKVYGKIASHSGGWGGYISYIERDLDNDKTIILLQNNDTPQIRIPYKNIRKILYNLPVYQNITLDNAALKSFEGVYLTEGGKENKVLLEKDKLYVEMGSDAYKMELQPVGKTRFVVIGFDPEVTYEFTLGANGIAEKYRVQQPEQGVDKRAKKIR
jgi:CubicO group peptidase (beta-lactamase class C family)